MQLGPKHRVAALSLALLFVSLVIVTPPTPLVSLDPAGDVKHGYSGYMIAGLELRRETNEVDPSWDYYFAVFRLRDVAWQNARYVSPYVAEVAIQVDRIGTGDVIFDHSPMSRTDLKGYVSYEESVDINGNPMGAWWHQEGSYHVFSVSWAFRGSAEYSIRFRVPEASHGSVRAQGLVKWYLVLPSTFGLYICFYAQDFNPWCSANW